MKYNIWNKWDPLKVCMLGNNYAPEFFNGVPDRVGDPLKRICEETLEDLDGFKKIMQDFGIEVIQPEMDSTERFLDNPMQYPRGPLQPRDEQLVIGNNCYITGKDHPAIQQRLEKYSKVSFPNSWIFDYPQPINLENYNSIAGSSYPSYSEFIAHRKNPSYFEDAVWEELNNMIEPSYDYLIGSAFVMLLGKKILVGQDFGQSGRYSTEELNQYIPALSDFNLIEIEVGPGHLDGKLHTAKPGVIFSHFTSQDYQQIFTGWDVCYPQKHRLDQFNEFMQLKQKNSGKWWVKGQEHNDAFTEFVEQWLTNWVGYVEETNFDINVLMLDDKHCCISNINNENQKEFAKKHNIELIHVPWRHRYFWDGGLHCITLDLFREGSQKDYGI